MHAAFINGNNFPTSNPIALEKYLQEKNRNEKPGAQLGGNDWFLDDADDARVCGTNAPQSSRTGTPRRQDQT